MYKHKCRNNSYNADGIIESILQTGEIPNIAYLTVNRTNGHKITLNKNTFNKLIKSIQISVEEYTQSQIEIHSLQNKIEKLETEIKNVVCSNVAHLICFSEIMYFTPRHVIFSKHKHI